MAFMEVTRSWTVLVLFKGHEVWTGAAGVAACPSSSRSDWQAGFFPE